MITIFSTIVGIFVLALVVYIIFVSCISLREGHVSGKLMEFDRVGIFLKTWEGYIRKGEYDTSNFFFSVNDDQEEVIEKLKDSQGKYIKLHYNECYGVLRWRGDTKYFVKHMELETAAYYLKTNAPPLSPPDPEDE